MILVDTREQAPFAFRGYDVNLETATLPVGDYSIPGFIDRVAIEKKSLGDLISYLLGSNRERFEKELARGRTYDLFCIVVEATLADVFNGKYHSDMKPHSALQSIIAFMVRYRAGVLWCGNRSGAEYMTYWLLAKYLREIEIRYQQAMKGQKNGEKEKAA